MRKADARKSSRTESLRSKKFKNSLSQKNAADRKTKKNIGVRAGWHGDLFPEAHKFFIS